MIRAIKAERLKLKRKHIQLMFLAVFFVSAAWIGYCVYDMDMSRLNYMPAMITMNFLIMNTILSPIIIAALASRISDVELSGGTYKWIACMQSPESIIYSKIITGVFQIFVYAAAQSIFLYIVCLMYGVLPWHNVLLFFIAVFFTFFEIFIFQLNLSLWSQNQLTPLFIGIAGTFAGLFSWFLPQIPLRFVIPWGYFAALCNIGMNYDSVSRFAQYYYTKFPVLWLVVLIAAIILGLAAILKKFKNKIKNL